MTPNETVLELITHHVLGSGEEVEQVRDWSDGIALTTNRRHFVAGSEPEHWALSTETWVSDVVVAVQDDLLIHGQMERFGFLMLTDNTNIYLNDQAAVADLGTRLAEGMDPLGFAEILVDFHPYSRAFRAVLKESDELRRVFAQPDLPEVRPIQLDRSADGLMLTFSSFTRYTRSVDGLPLLDVAEWTVEVPANEPARWTSKQVVSGVRLTGRMA